MNTPHETESLLSPTLCFITAVCTTPKYSQHSDPDYKQNPAALQLIAAFLHECLPDTRACRQDARRL